MNRIALLAVIFFVGCASAQISERSNVNSFKDVPYETVTNSASQTLDIYLPEQTGQLAPVHVFVHGGAWTKGDKSMLDADEVRAYTERGIVLVSINYRLGPEHKYPSNIKDIVSASSWLRANISSYGGDPSRMVLSGHSAGAHLVALYGVGTPAAPSPDSATVFRAIFSVDTASYDLTVPSTGPLSRLVNRQKRQVFGRRTRDLISASPTSQVEPTGRYSSMYLYVTETRPDAVQHMRVFKRRLLQAKHQVSASIVTGDLSHSEMKCAIFDTRHPIYKDILAELDQKQVN